MNQIKNKIAVITGSTQGLGAEIARTFADSNVDGLVLCGRSKGRGRKIALQIKNDYSVPTEFVEADLSNISDCRKVIRRADQSFGRIDILVNSAGISERGSIVDTSEDLFDKIFAINTKAPFFLIQETVKIMIRENLPGTIVNIGSTSAHAGQPFIAPYSASKGALETLTRNCGYALMKNQIRVNQLNIGWMASDGEDTIQKKYHNAKEDWLEKASEKQPFKRLLQPTEVAKAVTFLASEDSGMMTGSVIHFDQSVWGAYSFSPPVPEEPMSV